LPQSLREVEVGSTFRYDPCNAATLQRQRCNGATKLRDKMQEKLPNVTAPLLRSVIGKKNLAPLSRPIRSKTQTNRDLLARVFPRLA